MRSSVTPNIFEGRQRNVLMRKIRVPAWYWLVGEAAKGRLIAPDSRHPIRVNIRPFGKGRCSRWSPRRSAELDLAQHPAIFVSLEEEEHIPLGPV
jgi:hypothetical protein